MNNYPTKQDKVIHGFGIGLIVSYLLDYMGHQFKRDNEWYKGRNKQLLNQLLESNKPILIRAERTRLLTHLAVSHLQGDPLANTETLTDETDTSFEIIRNFAILYYESSPAQITDLWIIVKNLLDGKKVYTQTEVDDLLKSAQNSGGVPFPIA